MLLTGGGRETTRPDSVRLDTPGGPEDERSLVRWRQCNLTAAAGLSTTLFARFVEGTLWLRVISAITSFEDVLTVCPYCGRTWSVGAEEVAPDGALGERPRLPGKQTSHRSRRMYLVLSRINQAIHRLPASDQAFQTVCQVLVKQGGFQIASVVRQVPGTSRSILLAQWNDHHDRAGYSPNLDAHSGPDALGSLPQALREGRPCVCNDVFGDDRHAALARGPGRSRLRDVPAGTCTAACAGRSTCSHVRQASSKTR